MAEKCPYCSQINTGGNIRCIFCRRYIEVQKKIISEEDLLSDELFDYRKGIKLDLKNYSDKDLTREEFLNIAKVTGIVVAIVSLLILILRAVF